MIQSPEDKAELAVMAWVLNDPNIYFPILDKYGIRSVHFLDDRNAEMIRIFREVWSTDGVLHDDVILEKFQASRKFGLGYIDIQNLRDTVPLNGQRIEDEIALLVTRHASHNARTKLGGVVKGLAEGQDIRDAAATVAAIHCELVEAGDGRALPQDPTEADFADALERKLPPIRCQGEDWWSYDGGRWGKKDSLASHRGINRLKSFGFAKEWDVWW